jgi:hypothetical protein
LKKDDQGEGQRTHQAWWLDDGLKLRFVVEHGREAMLPERRGEQECAKDVAQQIW